MENLLDILQDKQQLIQNIAMYYGLFAFSSFFLKSLNFFRKIMFRFDQNLLKKYGEDSWVLITGGSDGLGKQFAIQLAQQKFNIIIVARNQEKMNKVADELKQFNVKVKTIVADFKKSNQIEFYDKIKNEIKDLDVSFLINNVGIDELGLFNDHSDEKIIDIININCMPITFLCKQLIQNHFQKRKNKSAIINVGSYAGIRPTIFFSVYCGSKAYINFLSQILSQEYKNIDIMVLNPNEVSTNMTFNKPTDMMTIMPQDCVKAALRDLGKEYQTDGHWNHKIQAAIYNSTPTWLFNFVAENIVGPDLLKKKQNQLKKQ